MTGYTKLVLYSIAGILLAGSVFVFVLNPALKRASELAVKEKDAQLELQRVDQQILAYKTAQSDLSRAEDKNLLFSVFVNETNLHIPIEEIEEGAQRTGTTYQLKILRDSLTEEVNPEQRRSARASGAVKKVTTQTELEEVPYTLVVQNSSYSDMLTFLKYVEHVPQFTEVSSVDMTLQEEEESGDLITATINGVFLVQKNETTTN